MLLTRLTPGSNAPITRGRCRGPGCGVYFRDTPQRTTIFTVPRLILHLLGQPRIEHDGAAVVVDTRKAAPLLPYLAHSRGAHSQVGLAALLWPEDEHARAFVNLRRTVWALSKALGAERAGRLGCQTGLPACVLRVASPLRGIHPRRAGGPHACSGRSWSRLRRATPAQSGRSFSSRPRP